MLMKFINLNVKRVRDFYHLLCEQIHIYTVLLHLQFIVDFIMFSNLVYVFLYFDLFTKNGHWNGSKAFSCSIMSNTRDITNTIWHSSCPKSSISGKPNIATAIVECVVRDNWISLCLTGKNYCLVQPTNYRWWGECTWNIWLICKIGIELLNVNVEGTAKAA
jgi:hypothetical protein